MGSTGTDTGRERERARGTGRGRGFSSTVRGSRDGVIIVRGTVVDGDWLRVSVRVSKEVNMVFFTIVGGWLRVSVGVSREVKMVFFTIIGGWLRVSRKVYGLLQHRV